MKDAAHHTVIYIQNVNEYFLYCISDLFSFLETLEFDSVWYVWQIIQYVFTLELSWHCIVALYSKLLFGISCDFSSGIEGNVLSQAMLSEELKIDTEHKLFVWVERIWEHIFLCSDTGISLSLFSMSWPRRQGIVRLVPSIVWLSQRCNELFVVLCGIISAGGIKKSRTSTAVVTIMRTDAIRAWIWNLSATGPAKQQIYSAFQNNNNCYNFAWNLGKINA